MAIIKPFKGIRPPRHLVEQVASRPYDVLNSEEARAEAEGNPLSLYHIIKPEIDFAPGTDEHEEKVYAKAAENFALFRKNGWLVQDAEDKYYVYAQTMNGKTQYGLVVCAHVDDYLNENIKKHELTRRDKEEDRMKHVRVNNANIEPVFFAYPQQDELDDIVRRLSRIRRFMTSSRRAMVSATTSGSSTINQPLAALPNSSLVFLHCILPTDITAARLPLWWVSRNVRQNPNHTGDEEYNYFMAVCFPDNQLNIIDYNRVVKDLNNLSDDEFLEKLSVNFDVDKKGR